MKSRGPGGPEPKRGIGEKILIDRETWCQALAVRRGFRDRWEYFLELSAVPHNRRAIESWHDFLHLPRDGRGGARRDRLSSEAPETRRPCGGRAGVQPVPASAVFIPRRT